MKLLAKLSKTEIQRRFISAPADVMPVPKFQHTRGHALKQRGVVLFFALIALVVMSLAAVALIRSVDTSTLIAGNLAFKQGATSTGDTGIEAAVTWLAGIEAANIALNVYNDPSHPFNQTCLTAGGSCTVARPGYHSSADPALNLTNDATWNDVNNILLGPDGNGNTLRYIMQRMCRNANQIITKADCLYSGALVDTNGQNIPLPQDICQGTGCPTAGQSPMIRITVKTTGPKNTISYIQAFVY